MLFVIFLIAAIVTILAVRAPLWQNRFTRGPRREGLVVMLAVLLATLLGIVLHDLREISAPGTSPLAISFAPLLIVTGALYLLAALRGRFHAPTWISDLLVIAAAALALWISKGVLDLRDWTTPLTIFWMWLLARMTAALNRTPQVTGGYIGLVALSLLFLMLLEQVRTAPFFSLAASAALSGAGLATVPLALKKSDFNIGWAASLSLGFLIAQIAALGLIQNAAFFILLLSLIAFGLPLLDVSFLRIRAALRGEQVKVEEQRLRLHEALLRRGVAPAKVTLLYLAGGAWLCLIGVLLTRAVFTRDAPWWASVLRASLVAILLGAGFVLFFSLARVWMRRGQGEVIPDDVEAFGVRISPVSMSEALDKIESFIHSRQPHHVVTSDANAILRAHEDPEYAAIIRRAALITPDGFGVVWGARLLNLPIYERVTGVDMVTGICERAAKNGYRVFILGSEPGIAETAAQNLMQQYSGLQIVGTHHGMILKDPQLETSVLQLVKDLRPDVLFVAMGIPTQEKFIAKHLNDLSVPVSLGVGGSFDVYAGKYKRAPEQIQRLGLEWIYRVWIDPSRWKRMGYVPRFMAFALKTWLFGPRTSEPEYSRQVDS